MMKSIKLSNSEEILMNLFWSETMPLTSIELTAMTEDMSWSSNYIHKLLVMLQEKGFLEMCGVERRGKHYVRQFEPLLSKEDYAVRMLEEQNLGISALGQIAMGFVKKADQATPEERQALINDLKHYVELLEQQGANS